MAKYIHLALGAACLASITIVSVPAAAATMSDGAQFPATILRAHNLARSAAGLARLTWDDKLGVEAASYAFQLALTNRFAHASQQARRGNGENLWMGTRSSFSVPVMVGNWLSEGSMFRAGVFPAVSRSGNWQDVGHYTQIMWPQTQRVGCALATNARNDFLVCRYYPAGNVQGVTVQLASLARR